MSDISYYFSSKNVVTFVTVSLFAIISLIIISDWIMFKKKGLIDELPIEKYDYSDITYNKENKENFGALQSLYSNDGAQDAYLTVENDPDLNYDPYGYWRPVMWDLPTRNLTSVAYYPYLYERHIDRYGTMYPYWSL